VSRPDPDAQLREVAREVLRELVPELLHEALAHAPATGNGNGAPPAVAPAPAGDGVVPQVPAPPVAAVLRPSTWSAPAAAGEVIGGGAPPSPAEPAAPAPAAPASPTSTSASIGPGIVVETVTIDTDDDLERFARALAKRVENPRDRIAIRAGRLRFALHRTQAVPGAAAATGLRVAKGAVTERTVREAAAGGARLVLGRAAVLTPLAREQARALGVEIERER
jgi:hypothetical protein